MPAVGQDTRPVNVKAHTRKAPTPKPKKVKVKVSQAPVRTPDSRDNNAAARAPKPPANPSPDARDVTERSRKVPVFSVPGATSRTATITLRQHDQQVAADAQAQARAKVAARRAPKVKTGHGPGHLLASINPAALVNTVAHGDFGGLQVIPSAVKVAGRAAKDAEEMAVTLPSSVAHVVETAVTHPKKLPGELAAPYKELAKHPIKTLSEHPLQTALMVAPAVRMPGRAVGKVARVTGKQTLERPPAVLPNTALKETRTGSRDIFARAMQARADRENPVPVASVKDVQRRVDEFHDAAKQHTRRTRVAATRQVKERGLTGDAAEEHISGAVGGAHTHADRQFGREFGAVHQVSPQGHIVVPKGATEGALHDTEAAAAKVADRLNSRPVAVMTGQGKATMPLEFTVRPAGDQFAVVPKVAATRLTKQQVVGSSPATMAKVMRRSRGAFTQAVLPFSAKWLAGQGGEAGIRSAVAGAGPFDWLRMSKVVQELNDRQSGAGDALLDRINGGQLGLTGAARDFAQGKSLADEFEDTSLARPAAAATRVGNVAPIKAVRKGFNAYSNAVMGSINGVIENNARQAMAGQAIKNLGLIDHHLIGLTDAAIKDAADKLQHTENQVALGRAVNDMYGKYQGFSPDMRSLLLHWTPFLPWYLNVATFLGKVLPHDHPVQAALLADINAAEEDWRKAHHLSLNQKNHVPNFLLGRVPNGKGGLVPLAHYTPFGVGSDPTGAAGALALPQFIGPILNAYGVDWKGDQLTTGGKRGKPFTPTQKALRALVTAVEEQIPGVTQAGAISGLTPRYVNRDTPAYIKTPGEVLKGYLPTTATTGAPSTGSATLPLSGASAPARPRAVRVKPTAAARSKVKAVRVKPVKVR
jgi:hypothetical protein